jgi:hypothetical protein
MDINKLIADTQAQRAASEAQKAAADKAAAALKASKKANQSVRLQVDDKLNYANALSQTIADIEAKLTVYGTQIGRGDKLGPGEQKEFDTLVKQYKSTDSAYQKTVKQVDSILAKAPSPTKVEVKGGKAVVAPTAEEIAVTGATNQEQKTPEQKPEDFAALIKTAPDFIGKMKGPERKLLAQSLNDSLGLKLPVSELVDPAVLLGAYQSAISGAQARYNTFKDILSVNQYLAQKKLETAAVNAAGGSANKLPEPSTNISAGTEAASSISSAFKNILGREATPVEIAKLTKELNAAERDPKNAQRATRNKNGVVEYSGGLKVDQWLADKLQALPEFATKKQAQQDLTTQSISSTALANGIKLSDAQLKTYSDRVKNGEDIKTIEAQIRNTAGLGQPDTIKKMLADGTDLNTIYDPYRRLMATSLGVTPDSITLDDPTLRMAIGPDKEMSLYDYKKAIRQDNRWKYSEEANNEVTNMINQVKRDFGFMG